jgi:Type II CAAX prenyl endopeptidase Rce1-like
MAAYGTGATLWFLTNHFLKSLWSNDNVIIFKKPWLEFVYSIIAVITILGIGQLYVSDLLIPNDNNKLIDAINQFLIFSPTLLLILIRKQGTETIWLPKSKILIRISIGLGIAIVSLLIYWFVREKAATFQSIIINTYHPKNISHLVQVFMEDITIALIFVRLSAWIGNKWSIGLVALLFAVGHIPSMLSTGATIEELGSLFLDVLIGVVILSAVSKSKDIWWFFMLHFALDMTQFYGGLQ